MKISLHWLRDFVEFTETDPQEIARRITACTAEVEEVEVLGALLDRCCVGQIATIRKHPQADRLSVCDVRTDAGVKRVVCGGTNLREGMKVAFAHVGARVQWHGGELVTLTKAKIRGEESEGMVCAAEELGIAALFPPTREDGERPIADLGGIEAPVGAPLREALGLDDVVLHIDNHAITHRPDLFSQRGFARECVATGLAAWKRTPRKKAIAFGAKALPFRVRNKVPALTPRSCACLLSIDSLGVTPDWMKRRLEATGWRSVSLPVDITNYVAMELGMPLHSFDADDFSGDVTIRASEEGESIVTLDGERRLLPDGAIVLSDDAGIFDLLGIMGGLRSSTKESTRRIYLHSTIVDPVSIRRAVIATGHRTDAATVYEKGIPRITAKEGFLRALELMLALVPGAAIVSRMEDVGEDGTAPAIALDPERVTRLLGQETPAKRMRKILTDLGCAVAAGRGKRAGLRVTPPLFRPDLRTTTDLAEEIGRIEGFDAIEPRMPAATTLPPPRDQRVNLLREALREQTYLELVPLSLVGASLLERAGCDPANAIAVHNAINDETRLLQTSTLPGLLDHAQRNLAQVPDALRAFTIARVFERGPTRHTERSELGILVCAAREEPRRPDRLKHEPLLLLRRELHDAFGAVRYAVEEEQCTEDLPPFAHPGRAASLMVGTTRIGLLCELHPDVRNRFALPGRAAAALVDLTALRALAPAPAILRPIPQFPSVQYDVTVTESAHGDAGKLLRELRGADPLLESVDVIDLYTGTPRQDDQYNLTLRFTYRAPDRTLTEEEARAVHAKLSQRIA